MEYHWGKQSWWIWLVAGLSFCVLSLFVKNDIVNHHRRLCLLLPVGHPRDVPAGEKSSAWLVSRKIPSGTIITKRAAKKWRVSYETIDLDGNLPADIPLHIRPENETAGA